MALIFDKILLRLDLHILSMGYLEDMILHFTKVIKHDNIRFNYKVVENEDSKEDSKEAVTNSKKKASKKKARHKAKRDAARA